ncbi:hypothetical protein H0H87_005770 [Tephrocybe sp. NHM501043]|nr:hypothetical protein H0H87_005770 [Tephrocybe sp. NHM501043]
MSREGDEPDNTPPRSLVDPDEFRSKTGSPRTRSPRIQSPIARSKTGETLLDLANSPMSYRDGGEAIPHDDDDADSNVQEGRTSEAGDTILPVREPSRNDPPGPKYESYDSGPSFGNFGPLPTDDDVPAPTNNFSSWNPNWAQIRSKSPPPSNLNENATEGGQSAQAAKIPLPPSEFAMSPRGTNTEMNRRGEPMSPRSATKSPIEKERAMSPMSGRSQLTSKGRNGTAEQPFAPSSPNMMSPHRSKAASISPSDSPSQARPSQTPSRKTTKTTDQYRGSGSVMSGGHQSRPFSPYRHAATHEDLLHAAIRGRAYVIPEEEEKVSSVAPTNRSKAPSQVSKAPSQGQSQLSKAPSQQQSQVQSQMNGKAPSSHAPSARPASAAASRRSYDASHVHDDQHLGGDTTPRARSPEELLDQEEQRIVRAALAATPRTSYYAEPLEPSVSNHYHDLELCVLLHQESDPSAHDVVKRALRKAIVQRVKKLGMKHDHESLKQYKRSHHDHNPLRQDYEHGEEPPQWAADIKRELVLMQQRIESLGPKIENLRPGQSHNGINDSRFAYQDISESRTPNTQTVHLQTQPTGTAVDSMYQGAQTEFIMGQDGELRPRHPNGTVDEEDDDFDNRTETETHQRGALTDAESATIRRGLYGNPDDRDDSPGQQYLEEELYRLRQRQGSQSGRSHHTWLVSRDPGEIEDYDEEAQPPSGMPTIPDTNGGGYAEREGSHSPPLPALPEQDDDEEDEEVEPHGGVVTTPQGPWSAHDYDHEPQQTQLPPWQRIHSRLLSWAVIWPQAELDAALNSTTRGQQVDEVALSVWSTQTYKRYVRARLTDRPAGVVDRLFVPPNMADAISNAVYNGQHGNACGMLRDLWTPFGLPGMPRLLVVLAKHRSENDHWVVHRYSLPEGTLMTYDSYSGRSIMDGRPLGWWFAIRIAWPNANYPSPDHLEQKMVRLHRPTQLPIDNSVAAAGIWRNILMGSRGERSLDLERLRDLINTEVKNLRQRKLLGRLSIAPPRQALNWEH